MEFIVLSADSIVIEDVQSLVFSQKLWVTLKNKTA